MKFFVLTLLFVSPVSVFANAQSSVESMAERSRTDSEQHQKVRNDLALETLQGMQPYGDYQSAEITVDMIEKVAQGNFVTLPSFNRVGSLRFNQDAQQAIRLAQAQVDTYNQVQQQIFESGQMASEYEQEYYAYEDGAYNEGAPMDLAQMQNDRIADQGGTAFLQAKCPSEVSKGVSYADGPRHSNWTAGKCQLNPSHSAQPGADNQKISPVVGSTPSMAYLPEKTIWSFAWIFAREVWADMPDPRVVDVPRNASVTSQRVGDNGSQNIISVPAGEVANNPNSRLGQLDTTTRALERALRTKNYIAAQAPNQANQPSRRQSDYVLNRPAVTEFRTTGNQAPLPLDSVEQRLASPGDKFLPLAESFLQQPTIGETSGFASADEIARTDRQVQFRNRQIERQLTTLQMESWSRSRALKWQTERADLLQRQQAALVTTQFQKKFADVAADIAGTKE